MYNMYSDEYIYEMTLTDHRVMIDYMVINYYSILLVQYCFVVLALLHAIKIMISTKFQGKQFLNLMH